MKVAGRGEPLPARRVELQLDTAQILLVVAALLGLCAAAFYLGRWFERDAWKDAAGMTPGSQTLREADAAEDLTFFDTLGSGAGEPGRQENAPRPGLPAPARPAGTTPAGTRAIPPRAPPDARTPGVAAGWSVQVFAGDRAQADRIAAALSRKGHGARVIAGTTGPGSARVRVYGYPSRAEADRAAERLKREERLAPWVVKPE